MSLRTLKYGLTLKQPWASAIAQSSKRVENRGWEPTVLRVGDYFAIHAGMSWEARASRVLREHMALDFRQDDVPFGAVVAVARYDGLCTQAEGRADPWFAGPLGWKLGDVRRLLEPVAVPGQQGLWLLERESSCNTEDSVRARVLSKIPAPRGQAVCVFVVRAGKLAAIRSTKNNHRLELPGGKVHTGETVEKAAVRELHEETGLFATNLLSLGTLTVNTFETHVFLADARGELRGSEEGEALWVSRDQWQQQGTYRFCTPLLLRMLRQGQRAL